jgi:hypothetical protein
LPWFRNFSAFSSALLLLNAMDDVLPPVPACRAVQTAAAAA